MRSIIWMRKARDEGFEVRLGIDSKAKEAR